MSTMLLLLVIITLLFSISGFVVPTKCGIFQKEQRFWLGSSLRNTEEATEGNLEKNTRIAKLEFDLETEKSKLDILEKDFETLLTLVKDAQVRETDLLENLSVLEVNARRDENVVSEATQALDDARKQLARAVDRCTKAEEVQEKSIQTQKDRQSSLAAAKQDVQQHSETIKCLKEQLETFQSSITSIKQRDEERSRQLVAIEAEAAKNAEQERLRIEALKQKEAKAEEQRQKDEILKAKKEAEEERQRAEAMKKKEAEDAQKAKKLEEERQRVEALKKEVEEERQRVEALKKKQADEAQQAKKAEEERQRVEALKKKEAEEAQRAKEAEEERQRVEAQRAKEAEEERQRVEALKKKEAEEARQAKEAEEERQRVEAIKRKEAQEAEEELKRLEAEAEKERQRIEALKRKEIEEEAERVAKEAEEELQKMEALEKKEAEERIRKEESKRAAKPADLPVINDWKITSAGEVMGVVTGHAAMEDNDLILTSPLANRNEVAENTVVSTKSGSKYFLAKREKNVQPFKVNPASYARSLPVGGKTKDKTETKEALAFFTKELGLNGKKLTGAKTYFLAGKPTTTSSGRSKLWTAYLEDPKSGLPTGDALAVKISSHREGMERDHKNYKKVTNGFLRKGEFCRQIEFIPSVDWNKNECALVMDKGKEDLREFIDRQIDELKPRDLRDAASAAASCIDALHAAKLLWTDLKAENFVVFDTDEHVVVKGIDLESSMPFKSNPVDYSPEACPPEFAKAYLGGEGSDFILESSYDIWSFGMLLYELATGRGYFETKSGTKFQPTQIMKSLCDITPDVTGVKDEKLRDLISQCLSVDPKKRPTISQVLLHPYFLTTGVGPFSFFL